MTTDPTVERLVQALSGELLASSAVDKRAPASEVRHLAECLANIVGLVLGEKMSELRDDLDEVKRRFKSARYAATDLGQKIGN